VDVARGLRDYPRETLAGAREGLVEGVQNATGAAVRQGALQVGGNLLTRTAQGTGRWFMDRATTRISATLGRDFPELSQTLINNAITVSRGGLRKARRLLGDAKEAARAALGGAEASGARVPVQLTEDIAESLITAITQDAVRTGQATGGSGGVVRIATERLSPKVKVLLNTINSARSSGRPMVLTPAEADLLKTQLQRESRRLYRALNMGTGTPAIERQAGLVADFATTLNNAIGDVVPGYRAANAVARPLIGAERGVTQSIRPQGGMVQAMVRPAAGAVLGAGFEQTRGGDPVRGALVGGLLTTPSAMSREAIVLAHPAMQAVFRQLPRAAAALLTRALGLALGPEPNPRETAP
jgi:hypothetical protein